MNLNSVEFKGLECKVSTTMQWHDQLRDSSHLSKAIWFASNEIKFKWWLVKDWGTDKVNARRAWYSHLLHIESKTQLLNTLIYDNKMYE